MHPLHNSSLAYFFTVAYCSCLIYCMYLLLPTVYILYVPTSTYCIHTVCTYFYPYCIHTVCTYFYLLYTYCMYLLLPTVYILYVPTYTYILYTYCMYLLLPTVYILYVPNLVEAHCYGIGRTGQIVEQSRSSEKQIECRRSDREGLRQVHCN